MVQVAQKYRLFSHFDEVWLYEDRPVVEKPNTFSIVPPIDLARDPPSKELREWFLDSRCILGLGDGIGMNYLTISEQIRKSLIM